MRWLLLIVIVLLIGAGALLLVEPEEPTLPPSVARPATFAGSESCRECHKREHRTWLKTAHAYALREPLPETVAGRFDGKPVEAKEFTATPEKRGDEYWIVVRGKSEGWPSGDHKIARVIGRTFEQAYLFKDSRGAWRVLPICWSIERGEWDLTHEVLHDIAGSFNPVAATFDVRTVVFNHGCAQCHATDYDVGYEFGAEGRPAYRSTFLEGAVACESCHGPGSEHVRTEGEVSLLHPRTELDARAQLESCGRCHYFHEWRYAIDEDPRVGYHDIAITLNFNQPGFFADGRISGLRYHGSTQSQSACYLKGGMGCLDCHSMHSGKRFAMRKAFTDGADAQCTQCHDEPKWASKEHTFHDDVKCVDCHMPKFLEKPRLLHFLRDHSIRSPEPELTERFGSDQSPNACNLCHKDKTAGWAREWKQKWYGPPSEATRRRLAGTEVVVALRRAPKDVKTDTLVALAQRAESQLFFRLTAVRALGERAGDPAARAAVHAALADKDVEILQTALAGAVFHRAPEMGPALVKLLDHDVRTVRVAAAHALARLGWRDATGARDDLWQDALAMLTRQAHFADALEPIVLIGDALGKFEEVVPQLVKLVRAAPAAAAEGLHRRGRSFTENGAHEDALAAYAKVRSLIDQDDPLQAWLLMDSADSVYALRQQRIAADNWNQAMRAASVPAPLREIARARLEALADKRAEAIRRLDELRAKLAKDPVSGEYLRRIDWALDAIRK